MICHSLFLHTLPILHAMPCEMLSPELMFRCSCRPRDRLSSGCLSNTPRWASYPAATPREVTDSPWFPCLLYKNGFPRIPMYYLIFTCIIWFELENVMTAFVCLQRRLAGPRQWCCSGGHSPGGMPRGPKPRVTLCSSRLSRLAWESLLFVKNTE